MRLTAFIMRTIQGGSAELIRVIGDVDHDAQGNHVACVAHAIDAAERPTVLSRQEQADASRALLKTFEIVIEHLAH